jgi:hypothetical protein
LGLPRASGVFDGLSLKGIISNFKLHRAVIGWGINVGPTGENGYTPNYVDMMFNDAMKNQNLDFASLNG